MGIYLHLVDLRSPRGYAVIPTDHHSAFQRIDVAATDTMNSVVSRIFQFFGNDRRNPHPLDMIRIEAHGTNAQGDPNSSIIDTIQFGAAMDVSTVGAFSRIAPLWHIAYRPDCLESQEYRAVFPRIEMHCCGIVPRCNPILQSLANAARAPVFASRWLQCVSNEPCFGSTAPASLFGLEGPISRFNPM
jgi:hypothetical protein